MNLRALLLAAGYGTRLRPTTLNKPKCLVEVGGEPLIGRWLRTLESMGCEAALVNTHYLNEQVTEFLSERQKTEMKVIQFYEKSLLGTAGTLLQNSYFFKDSIGLLIHADNVTDMNLMALIEAHKRRKSGCLLTMLTFDTDTPSSCGIVETDVDGIVVGFHEKVAQPPGTCANGAVYVFEDEFLTLLKKMGPTTTDFSTEVLPKLIGQIQTYHTACNYIDIGTQASLRKARKIWPNSEDI